MNLHRMLIAVIALVALMSYLPAQESTVEEKQRSAFVRQNFTNFAVVKFLPPTNATKAMLQRFKVNEHFVGEFAGAYLSGIRFTMPDWVDGDFQWMFLHDYKQGDAQLRYQWDIIAEATEVHGFTNFVRRYLVNHPELQKQFPHTSRAIVQRWERQQLQPGKTYVLWWSHAQRIVPDILFAITIDSKRGHKEFGTLALTDVGAALEDQGPEQFAQAFIKQHFTNFHEVTLKHPTNKTETVIQRFDSFENEVGSVQQIPITGVRFTLPDWTDGDLQWVFFHLNPEEQKRQRVALMWGITSVSGEVLAPNPVRLDPDDNVDFWKRFPFTRRVYSHTIPRASLKPGQGYALYFGHFDATPPDIAFAVTIDSERGRREFGSLNFVAGRKGAAGQNAVLPRTAFLQDNFPGFPLFKFLAPTNNVETVFQHLAVNEQMVGEFEGQHYAGIRFTVPDWMDGDLKWAFYNLYRKRDLPRRFGISWNIVTDAGEIRGIGSNTERIIFTDYPEMNSRFPTTDKAYAGTIRRERLVPGRTYVFWLAYTQADVPDLHFALTIDSERGRKEFGAITWR